MIEMVSRKPRVWIRPATARLPSSMALVATVVPCAKNATRRSRSRTGSPASCAASASVASTPAAGSSGTVGAL